MRAFANTKILAVVAIAVLASLGSSSASADPVAIDLCATAGTASLPGASVPVWGFVAGDCTPGSGSAAAGGPVIEVHQDDVVTVHITNDLPAGHTASFELPGFEVTPLGGGDYEFTASRTGTFGYQSPGDAGRQEAMGLYGALVVRPAGAGRLRGLRLLDGGGLGLRCRIRP